jgi:hypothetical protein
VSIIVIILSFKHLEDKRIRRLFITALILLVLSAGILSVCLKIYKLGALAYIGQITGVAEGAYDTVKVFRYFALIGVFFELLCVALLAMVSKMVISPRTTELAGEEEGQ